MKKYIFLLLVILANETQILAQESNVVEVSFKNCQPSVELCGNGVDEDCNGSDLSCIGHDKDNDGFNSTQDCDDSNHFIYPSISVPCSSNVCAQGHKVCQNNGTYSACSCSPLCEATGSGRCYYVDPIKGDDNNTGSYQSKLKTLNRFGYYSLTGTSPNNRIALVAGDVVYMFSGTYQNKVNTLGEIRFLALRTLRGSSTNPIIFKNYPGQQPVISPPSPTQGLYVLDCKYLKFEGLIFDSLFQSALYLADSDNINLRNITIRNTDGVDNDNLAGFYTVVSTNIDLGNSVFHDNYDRTNQDTNGAKTENSRNIVLFRGGNIRIHHSAIFQTPAISNNKTGGCIALKHSQNLDGSFLEIDHNTFKNCAFNAIGTGGFNGNFHHNLILDSDTAFRIKDHGGWPNFHHNTMEYNTIINTTALEYIPSQAASVNKAFDTQIFRFNIIKDNKVHSSHNFANFMIDTYGPNDVYNQVVANNDVSSNNNCYYSSQGNSLFSFFADNRNDSTNLGGAYNLSEWQNLGFDSGSVEENPNLDSNFIPANENCRDKGYLPQ